MTNKTIQKMESLLGFIHIPSKDKSDLIGNVRLPFETKMNGCKARIDRYGRLWCECLRNKFPAGTEVEVARAHEGYTVFPARMKLESASSNTKQNEVVRDTISVQKEEKQTPTMEPYFQTDSLCIFNADILKTEAMSNNSIDLIVTSPPYGVDVKYETYDDSVPYAQYLEFTRKWLARSYDLVKNDGRLCLNIPLDKNKGGQQSVCADVTTIAKEVGWKYHSTIVWNEQNISRRTAWGSWLSASAPFVIAPVEVILVMYKNVWRKNHKGKSDVTRREFMDWTNGVWNFSGESKSRIGHPAPFPIELPKRCIKLFSYVGDTVLDPFLGSGTTLIACLMAERIGIGVEINRTYCDLAIKRLKEHGVSQKKLLEIV
jgi:site-specific DNA-methyltransferase (adenine-specific)